MNVYKFSKTNILLFVLFLTLSVIFSTKVSANSYDVTASIPFEVPSIPASVNIVSPTEVSVNNIDISGTCQALSPNTIVSIWRNATLIGSTVCQAGSFSLNIPLISGSNSLVARTSNISSVYGPDSTSFTVIYTPPTPNSTGGNNNPPSTSQPQNYNNPETSLIVTSPSAFGITNNDNTITITLSISGGNRPYILVINWGDGTTLTQDISQAGDYTFTHKYEKPNIYTILAKITDVLGKNSSFQWTAIPLGLPNSLIEENGDNSSQPKTSKGFNYFYIIFLVAIIIFVVVSTFLLGRYYQAKKDSEIIAKDSRNRKSHEKR